MLMRPLMFRGAAGGAAALRPQDVYSTTTYAGSGANRSVTTGIDKTVAGGLSWIKNRGPAAGNNIFFDTLRGANNALFANLTNGDYTSLQDSLTAFTALGFNLGADANGNVNGNNQSYVGWDFKRSPKFFDIVTYTGDGTSGRQMPHGLGIAPGMIIIKNRVNANAWAIFHRSLNGGVDAQFYNLSFTTAAAGAAGFFAPQLPDASTFTVSAGASVNTAGATYVAYLLAHDPDTVNGIVQCGSGNGGSTINLGWRPQFLLVKLSNGSGGNPNWIILDAARGWTGSADKLLYPNTSDAEGSGQLITPNATGFSLDTASGNIVTGNTYVYLAIRAPIA